MTRKETAKTLTNVGLGIVYFVSMTVLVAVASAQIACSNPQSRLNAADLPTCWFSHLVDAWSIMPESIYTEMNSKGMVGSYSNQNWAYFRAQADSVASSTSSYSNEFLMYNYYLSANVGNVNDTIWAHDTSELRKRVTYLTKAESLAWLGGAQEAAMLYVIRDYLRVVYTRDLGNDSALQISLNGITGYTGSPSSDFPASWCRALVAQYIFDGTNYQSAISQLNQISSTSTVRQISFLTLADAGLMYLVAGDTQSALQVDNQMKSNYADLWPSEILSAKFDSAANGKIYMIDPPHGYWNPGVTPGGIDGSSCVNCASSWNCARLPCWTAGNEGLICNGTGSGVCFDGGGGGNCSVPCHACEGDGCSCRISMCECKGH
jgi:hypothetical protein